MNETLSMLLGAALVAVGVLAAALADRIRGLRVTRTDHVPLPKPPRETTPTKAVVVPLPKPLTMKAVAAYLAEADRDHDHLGRDVVNALVAAGYKKREAEDAVWSCTAANRDSVENWTREALRRAQQGAAS